MTLLMMAKRPTGQFANLPDVLDAGAVGEILGISARSVFVRARTGKLPKQFCPGRWSKTAITGWIAEQSGTAGTLGTRRTRRSMD
jgi:predicted DNA-binding transcriptional regulator AlpA